MTHDEMIAVIQAHKDGKAIQYRFMVKDGWIKASTPNWNFSELAFRVKPEPKEYWLVPYADGTGLEVFEAEPDKTYAALNSYSSDALDFSGTIHVVTIEELTND
jgi:hypothetical protein